MSSRAVEDDALAKAARAVEALYLLRDTYFPPDPDDKISRLNIDSDLALNLLDSIPLGTDNEAELVDESIQHAKEAITLDVKDGNSFKNYRRVSCLCALEDVLMFYVAYQEKDERMQSNPDLYFNCATVKDRVLLIQVERIGNIGVDGGPAAKDLAPKFNVFKKNLSVKLGVTILEIDLVGRFPKAKMDIMELNPNSFELDCEIATQFSAQDEKMSMILRALQMFSLQILMSALDLAPPSTSQPLRLVDTQ
ncbi:unnamed protein product [Malus baccata var. baccata]